MKKYLSILVIVSFFAYKAEAQQLNIKDYNRAVQFMWPNLVNKKIFNINTTPYWFADSSGMAWINQDAQAKTFYKLLWNTTPELFFNHQQMAKLLKDSLKISAKENDLPINIVSIQNDKYATLSIAGKTYQFNATQFTLTLQTSIARTRNLMESISPDGKWIAYLDNYNLFIKSATSSEKKQLSTDGRK